MRLEMPMMTLSDDGCVDELTRGRPNFVFFFHFSAPEKAFFYFLAFYFSAEKKSAFSFSFLFSVLKCP